MMKENDVKVQKDLSSQVKVTEAQINQIHSITQKQTDITESMSALQSSVLEKLRKQENQLEKENENLQEEHEDWLDKVRKAKKQNKEK